MLPPFLIPAGMAVLGALFELHYYYYSIFKMIMIITDSGVFNFMILTSLKASDNISILYLGSSIVTFIITMFGIISVTTSGFPRDFWIVLDYIYATAKIIQLIVVIKDKAFN